MYLANNDVVKALVTAILLGQALAVPMPSVYNGEGAVLDTRDLEALDARSLDALEARDPRRRGGLFKGLKFGADLYNTFTDNNKRDVDETADEAAAYEEAADEESSGALVARDPRRGRGGLFDGFKVGIDLYDRLKGNNKRDVDEAAYEEAADEESSGTLVARDPRRRGGLFDGFKFGVDLYDRLKGNNKRDLEMVLQTRDLESIEARDLDMIHPRDLAMVMARDPARGGDLFQGFKYGLDLYSRLKGNNNKRDLDSALLARDLDTLEARDLEALMARDPRGRGLFKGFKFGVDLYDRIKGNNNNKRDVTDEAPEYEEEADEFAEESADIEARDLEVRDPRRGGGGFFKGIQFGADIYNRITGNNNNKRDLSDEAAEYEESADIDARDLHMLMARDLDMLMTRDPRRRGGFLKGLQFGADIYNRITGNNNNNKRDLSDETAALEEAAEVYARDLHMLMARDPRRRGGFLKGLQFGADIYNRITGNNNNNNNNNKRDLNDEAAVLDEAAEVYARDLQTLMARDPRRGGGFFKGLQFGADIYNRITGNNNKRDVIEEAPEYEEAAEEVY